MCNFRNSIYSYILDENENKPITVMSTVSILTGEMPDILVHEKMQYPELVAQIRV